MTLLRTTFFSFIATAIKMLAGLAINKAVALFVGPSGLAVIGQFQNVLQLSTTAAMGGISSGVTKYTAEYGAEGSELPVLLSTAARLTIICSFLVGVASILLATYAAEKIVGSAEYAYVFIVFGVTVPLFAVNQLLLSIVNGLKEVKTFVIASITQSVYALLFTTVLIVLFKLDGALIALVTNQSVTLLVLVWLLRNHLTIRLQNFRRNISLKQLKRLFGYSIMTLTAAITLPVSQLVVRNYIGENLGWEKAGYWQAIWYISTMYLTVLTTSLGVYYLPRLSEVTKKEELSKEILTSCKVILPLVVALSLLVYLAKDIVIFILFSKDFYPMRDLFAWQLTGDVIKICAWLLSYLMLAKAMIATFVVTEIFFSSLFVFLSFYLVDAYGLVGVTYAFSINYALYLLTMVFIVKVKFF